MVGHEFEHMLLAALRLEPGAVALEYTLQELPEVEIVTERIAAHSTNWTMPCLWASHSNLDAVDEALANDSSVDTIVETEGFDTEKYYLVEWSKDVEDRIDAYLDKQATVLLARATADGWHVRIRFVHREQFDSFRNALQKGDCSFRLLELTEASVPHQSSGMLTPEQRDALVIASQHGYFNVPREATVQDLAKELDKSHQAISELLRRGSKKLIDETLTTDETSVVGQP